MPTLAEKGKFQLYPKAIPTNEIKKWIEDDKAVDIIIKILKLKLLRQSKRDRLYFLKGRTGSGKSTYMIQEMYKQIIEGERGTVFCTQPRVVLTKSNPTELVRYNKEWNFGKNIGVQNGSERISPTQKDNIIYCTTAIIGNMLVNLLAEDRKDKQIAIMNQLKIVVIDECHVLDSPMMALLKNVFDVVNKFGEMKECPLFVFSSATIDIEHMVRYYSSSDKEYEEWLEDPLMIADVIGSPNFDVIEKFLSDSELSKLNLQEEKGNNGFELLANYFYDHCYEELWKSKSTVKVNDEVVKCRDALIFVPLFSAIGLVGDVLEKRIGKSKPFMKIGVGMSFNEVQEWRNKNKNKERVLFIGYGRNYAQASDRLLETSLEKDEEARKNEVKIICSTSVIETGKTISTLYYCVNMGIETISLYNPLAYVPTNGVNYLKQVPINKNQAIQRKGRVGREAPGIFLHFYSKAAYDKFRNNDIAETLNNSYLSGLVLNDLSQFELGTYEDVFNLNNYYYPTSTDIMINSARDLVNSGYLTLFGQFVELKNSLKHSENWKQYAKFLFYCLGYSLWEALLLASINRKSLPTMMNLDFIDPSKLRYQLKDIKDADDMIESIMRARNTMTSILYGNDETFKCSEDRIYNSINQVEKKTELSGGSKNNISSQWYIIHHLGRI